MEFLEESGFANLTWGNVLLILLGIGFVSVAIIKRSEPYVLLPIGLGIILGNLPGAGLEVWPESHWPGFALREADRLKAYMAW